MHQDRLATVLRQHFERDWKDLQGRVDEDAKAILQGGSARLTVVAADGQVLGRMASRVATLLRGKHKPIYTSYVDCGDCVIVTNAARVRLTGHKIDQKFYFSHSGFAGGKKITPVKLQMERDPRRVVWLAVKRMLSVNRLRNPQLKRLKIYTGPENPHAALVAAGEPKSEATANG